jgi:hypothetical protein
VRHTEKIFQLEATVHTAYQKPDAPMVSCKKLFFIRQIILHKFRQVIWKVVRIGSSSQIVSDADGETGTRCNKCGIDDSGFVLGKFFILTSVNDTFFCSQFNNRYS